MTEIEDTFEYPILTTCVVLDRKFYETSNGSWIDPAKYNFTFPFQELGVVYDKFYTEQL